MKIAFAGFCEVNTPIEIIERKCKGALEELKKSGSIFLLSNNRRL